MLSRIVEAVVNPQPYKITRDFYGKKFISQGFIPGVKANGSNLKYQSCYIISPDKPNRRFNGKVIATILNASGVEKWIVAPVNACYYEPNIRKLIDFFENSHYSIRCLYEKSCGAVIFRKVDNQLKFLAIRNIKGKNWGFPKGHIEFGETEEQTAKREVLEETNLKVNLIRDYRVSIHYSVWGKTTKKVVFFLANDQLGDVKIQSSEIEEYKWLSLDEAIETFKFDNDKKVLKSAVLWIKRNRLA